jgi:hypothetical protein
MDNRTLMLAGLITETQYRELKEKQESKIPMNENTLRDKIRGIVKESLSEMNHEDYIDEDYIDEEYLDEAKKDETEDEIDLDLDMTDDENMDFEGDETMDGMDEYSDNELMDHLEQALELAIQAGDDKLTTQIENTITFLTRSKFKKN